MKLRQRISNAIDALKGKTPTAYPVAAQGVG